MSSPRLLSILVPCFNERATVETLLRWLDEVPWPLEHEVVLVDDGSRDGSYEAALALQGRLRGLRVLRHERNRGKGAALRTALEAARGDVVAIQDADLEYHPAQLVDVLTPVLRGEARASYGSRRKGRPFVPDRGRALLMLGNAAVTVLANVLFGGALTDLATCHKVFDMATLRGLQLESNGFEFCAEVTAKLLRDGHRIEEVPIEYRPRTFAQGKKLTYRHGVALAWELVRVRRGRPRVSD